MKKILILTILLGLFIPRVRAFDNIKKARIDSLHKALKEATYDSTRVDILIHLARECHDDSLSLSIDYLYKAMEIGKELEDQRVIAHVNFNTGLIYQYERLNKKALAYYFKAYNYYTKTKDDKKTLMVLRSIIKTYYDTQENKLTDKYAVDGLKMARQLKDTAAIGELLNMRGLMALRADKFQGSLVFFEEALGISKKSHGKDVRTALLNNIGMAYNFLKKYDKALDYMFRSVKYAKEASEKNLEKMTLSEEKKAYYRKQINFNIGNTYINIGTVYKNKKEFDKAIEYCEMGIEATAFKPKAFYQQRKVYETLSQIYEGKKNNEKAFKYYKLFIGARDSLYNQTTNQQLDKIQSEHIAEKKEKEIASLRREAEIASQRNRVINTALGGGLFLVLSLAGLIYKRYDDKRKSHDELSERNHEITAQNHEISAQRDQIAEKNDKLVVAYQSITDSIEYAHRIQEALLPSLTLMQQTLPESMVMFKPRDVVSGDFYWFAKAGNQLNTSEGEQKVVLAAVDCTGHGVPGAFMSMAGDAYLNQIVKQQGITQPDQVLTALHQNIRLSLKQETTGNRDGMDIALVTIDQQKQEVHFAGAKNPLIYIQDGELHLIKGDKYPIGGEQREGVRTFTSHTIKTNPAKPTVFYLFSDGFQDQFGGAEGKKFMVSQFRDLLLSIHHLPMVLQKARLEQTLEAWLEDTETGKKYDQIDDVLVMGFKV